MANQIFRHIVNSPCRVFQLLRVYAYGMASDNSVNGSPRRLQPIQCVGEGRVSIENSAIIGVFNSPLFFSTYAYIEARKASASISIGAGTWINNNFCAIAEHTSISIGKRCLIGVNVEILDSDFHGMKVNQRDMSQPEWARPVRVGDDVFIGSNVKILKGVNIGSGSVIANGSVVVKDIPSEVIAAGNPARVIKAIN